MSEIKISGLTFGYEGSSENVFENVSFSIDTDWKLGFIGRNGKGKTTFLRLLLSDIKGGGRTGRKNRSGNIQKETYEYSGSIQTDTCFDYFPYEISAKELELCTIDLVDRIDPDYELWKICRELELLRTDAEILYRPFGTLSYGERTKVMLSVLFSRDNYFLLIDEPTDHLDAQTRELVCSYLKRKKGFILVSHDRWLLDHCVDHVLVLEKNNIRIEKGNFSTWWKNKERRDQYEQAENEKLKREISKLRVSADQTARWADQVESHKIGRDPVKEHDRPRGSREYIGEKSRRMQQRRKNLERRQQNAISEKEKLLKNTEDVVTLKLQPLVYHKERYIRAEDFCLSYSGKRVLEHFCMELRRGDRIVLQGRNGCGKTSLIRAILDKSDDDKAETAGILEVAAGLKISCISQDTSHLQGSLEDYIVRHGFSESLFKAILRQIGMERTILEGANRNLEVFSEGQKKKVLIAGSLITPAHLYIWDEPLNYIDIFSRMQIEELILQYQPTMLLVEHDRSFAEKCATQVLCMKCMK